VRFLRDRLRSLPIDLNPNLTEEVAGTRAVLPLHAPRTVRMVRAVEAALLLVATIFFALHFVHLRADFPNHSPWMDWSKYTDEGWYGDAAIRHYQLGHWNVPGDFNAAAALPVWPAIEMVLFRVTGVSLAAARALTVVVFGLTLVCCYWLIRRWALSRQSLAPAIAVLLLAISPFCYAFSRLAILEPMLILLTFAAMLAASSAGAASAVAWNRRFVVWAVALGLLLPLMVLTKTTGIFLFPAIFWLLWAASGYRVRPFVRVAAVACGTGAVAWGAYYGLFVRPHYLLDYRYLFSANAYTGITRATFWSVLHDTLRDGSWMGETLFAVAMTAVVASLVGLCFRRFRGNPLPVALLLWIFGYAAFLAYHDNLQPRYYLVLAVPLTLVAAIFFDALLTAAMGTWSRGASRAGEPRIAWSGRWLLRLTAVAGGGALGFAAIHGAWQTISFVRHSEYTWVSAAAQIDATIERELQAGSSHSRLVLSISGSDLALMTGLPAICDDFGTMTLPDRVAAFRPGWFATWNDVEDDKMEALAPLYRLVRVATIPAFDDPERNLLILYRLDPVSSPGPKGRPGRRRSLAVPNRLRTKVGEQPSPVQLTH
jgi:4-amino-4-deoxy-L-arabinose transferase-like glycosyltransferase